MGSPDFIITEMIAVNLDGSRLDVVVRIGKPFSDNGSYVCVVQIDGIRDNPRRVYGEEAMQALHLGLQLVKEELGFLEKHGAHFYLRGEDTTGEPFDWRLFWYGSGDPAR